MHLPAQLRFGIDAVRAEGRIGLGHDGANPLDIGGDGVADDEFRLGLWFLRHTWAYDSDSCAKDNLWQRIRDGRDCRGM